MKTNWLLAVLLLSGGCCFANVRLPNVLSDNMVLQQQSTVKLWGWCEPGEKVFVTPSWSQVSDSVQGTRDGRWEIALSTPAAGGPYTITMAGWNVITLRNVLIGEVWVCSGQSNMEMCETWGMPDVKAELPVCYNEKIRFFHVPRTTSTAPQDDCPGRWTVCDSNELKSFSAAGYFFGKELNKALDVPVGLIEVSWGGTPAEVWTPGALVTDDPVLEAGEKKEVPYNGWPYLPGYCYNGMIVPLTPFRIAGALWYQGEANVVAPETYARLLTTMIGAWRKAWNEQFPFYYVQIAPFTYGVKDQASLLREQEEKVQDVGGTGMVVVSDLVNDTTDIHPKDKHDVGLRLANWALAETYYRSGLYYKNPRFAGMETKGDKVIVRFADAPGGLTVKGPAVKTLMVAGDDRVFYPAEGRIEGDDLLLWSKAVKKPVAVRYQFSNAGIGNLFSKQGLPVEPFRTDDW
ncbi:MAG TPA: sialate O-acetylesterase [Puia sp.]|nr:sialate O-acetylesterase [Puia sp.]